MVYADPNEDRTPLDGREYLPKWLEPPALDAKYVAPAAQAAALALKQDVATLDSVVTTKATTGGTALNTALTATYAREFEPSTAIVYDGTTGNVTSSTEGGITTTYTYNADGTVNTETRLGKVRTWAYDGSGNPTSSTVV